MKRIAFVLILAGGAVALAASLLADGSHVAPQPLTITQSNTSPVGDSSAKVSTPASNAGFVVHFDESGQIVEEPTSVADFSAQMKHAISTSSDGLIEEATPVGNGVMVNLQGRFQSAMVGTVDANGNVSAPCLTNENDLKAFTSSTAVSTPAAKE